jgi:hypothetical protein
MNPTNTYYQDLDLLSRANPIGTTYEGVAPCTLARLGGGGAGTCRVVDVAPRRPKLHQVVWHDS